MGLGDLFGKKKHQKEKDAKIEQAAKLMAAGDYRAADEILWEVYLDFSHSDTMYRKDDLEALMAQCKAGLKQQEEQAKADKLAEKDKIIEEIKSALKSKNWRKAIELLDVAEDNYDINHRSSEMEDLCIQAQRLTRQRHFTGMKKLQTADLETPWKRWYFIPE